MAESPFDPYAHAEIAQSLAERREDVAAFFGAIAPERFFAGDASAWGPAHHLGHLAIAHVAVARALRRPDALPACEPAPARRLAAMREAYLATLGQAPKAFLAANPFTAKIPEGATVESCVAAYRDADAALVTALAAIGDATLDGRMIPHPLLGPIRVREMLLFILLHDQHHVDGVRRMLVGGTTPG
jgi:hypothetical protein